MNAFLERTISATRLFRLLLLILLLSTGFIQASYGEEKEFDRCNLLKDPTMRQQLGSGLEMKLMMVCGEVKRPEARLEAQSEEIDQEAPRPLSSEASGDASALSESSKSKSKFGKDILVNDPAQDMGGTTQSETSIAIRGGAVCAAWNDAGTGLLSGTGNGLSGFGFSRNHGRTWTDGGSFPVGPGFDQDFGDPSLAYGMRDRTFYYAALSTQGLSLWRSTDRCKSFSYRSVIHFGFDDKELMAIDNNHRSPFYGRIYVGWTNFGLGNDLNQTTFSDDGGNTWSDPVSLPGSGFNGQGMWPAVAPNGDVYFALLNRSFTIGGFQDQWIYKSIDGGTSWTQMTDIATAQLRPENVASTMSCFRQALNGDIRNLSSPQIAVHPDRQASVGYVIHAVYPYDSDGAGPDESNVFYRRSTDGALTWSPEMQLNDDVTTTDQWYPAIAVNERGVVVVSWYDRRLDPANNLIFDRFAVVSKDGGLNFGPNIRISDVSSPVSQNNPHFDGLARCYHGDYDQVAIDNGDAHIIWSDDRRVLGTGPDPDIYYDRLSLIGSSP